MMKVSCFLKEVVKKMCYAVRQTILVERSSAASDQKPQNSNGLSRIV